jgi:hypothetical protein|tara:strand:- start:1104 stop:1484 length:381 start_codon:yes stop_codon:yes gene_type:complete
MITKAQKKNILDAYNAFRNLDNLTHKPYRQEIFDLEKNYEKMHRKFCGGRQGLSVTVAAKYWTVRHLLDAFRNPGAYTVKDCLHVKKSIIYAQSVALNYRKPFFKALDEFCVSMFDDLDYCEMTED